MNRISLNGKEASNFIDSLIRGMTKKHYVELAKGLLQLKGVIPDDVHEEAVRAWADTCEKQNSNFNREKFYKAAGAYVPPPVVEDENIM